MPTSASSAEHRALIVERQVERERAPLPRLARHVISPPSRRASSRLMDRPSPVPPYSRLVDPSACWNASKMIAASRGDADAGVLNREGHDRSPRSSTVSSAAPARSRARSELTLALVGELERVREQVLEHLLQPLQVGLERRRHPRIDRSRRGMPALVLAPPGGRCARRIVAPRRSAAGAMFSASRAGFDLREVEDVVDQASRSVPDEWIVSRTRPASASGCRPSCRPGSARGSAGS